MAESNDGRPSAKCRRREGRRWNGLTFAIVIVTISWAD